MRQTPRPAVSVPALCFAPCRCIVQIYLLASPPRWDWSFHPCITSSCLPPPTKRDPQNMLFIPSCLIYNLLLLSPGAQHSPLSTTSSWLGWWCCPAARVL